MNVSTNNNTPYTFEFKYNSEQCSYELKDKFNVTVYLKGKEVKAPINLSDYKNELYNKKDQIINSVNNIFTFCELKALNRKNILNQIVEKLLYEMEKIYTVLYAVKMKNNFRDSQDNSYSNDAQISHKAVQLMTSQFEQIYEDAQFSDWYKRVIAPNTPPKKVTFADDVS